MPQEAMEPIPQRASKQAGCYADTAPEVMTYTRQSPQEAVPACGPVNYVEIGWQPGASWVKPRRKQRSRWSDGSSLLERATHIFWRHSHPPPTPIYCNSRVVPNI